MSTRDHRTPDAPGIWVDGLETWFPLDTELAPGDLAARLDADFGPDPAHPVLADGLSGVARRLREADDDSVHTVLAWVRTASMEEFVPLELATLRAFDRPTADADDAAMFLIGDEETYSSPVLGVLDTASGRAHRLTWRVVVEAPGARDVHEVNVVFWRRESVLLALSCRTADLAAAHSAAPALHQLAEGVHGL